MTPPSTSPISPRAPTSSSTAPVTWGAEANGPRSASPDRATPSTKTASGTISVRPSYGAGLEYGRINDPSYFFTYGGDLLGNKATPLMSAADGTSFWVAVRHQGTVNYEITQVGPTYITVVLQLRLP